jgi:TldD protein
MYQFPENLYTDVRIESVFSTQIALENYELKQNKCKTDKGAMIRIFDGNRWYYSATTSINQIQQEIDSLAKMATPNPDIHNHPVVTKFEMNKGCHLRYEDDDITKVDNQDKLDLLHTYKEVLQSEELLRITRMYYLDKHIEKHIISSKGTDVTFDTQSCFIAVRYMIQMNDIPYQGGETLTGIRLEELFNRQDKIKESINQDIAYCKEAVPVKPGVYTCILSPTTTGVFAHESFGHKSEADFMVGDETMKREWAIGKQVGTNNLNIIDTGLVEGSGYVPFDDEGNRAKENYIIKDGILTGRLHSTYTASLMEEDITGNARAINFEYEPIVRMTTTYIGAGNETKDELFARTKEGIYIEDINHGSGMTTFTIAPRKAYMIRDGKIAEPVRISVITGNVMKTLYEIDGITNEVELFSFALGGCGKMEQYPLPVGFGGPYIRVNGINVG